MTYTVAEWSDVSVLTAFQMPKHKANYATKGRYLYLLCNAKMNIRVNKGHNENQ